MLTSEKPLCFFVQLGGYQTQEAWRSRPLERAYPYVYVDGIYLKRSWGGSYENVAVMVAIGVNDDGYREVIGAPPRASPSRPSAGAISSPGSGRGA